MENTMELQEIITAKKMKMIFSILPESYTNGLTQKKLDTLLKTPLVKLETKLEKLTVKLMMDALRDKYTSQFN
jgi:hypothetical protein